MTNQNHEPGPENRLKSKSKVTCKKWFKSWFINYVVYIAPVTEQDWRWKGHSAARSSLHGRRQQQGRHDVRWWQQSACLLAVWRCVNVQWTPAGRPRASAPTQWRQSPRRPHQQPQLRSPSPGSLQASAATPGNHYTNGHSWLALGSCSRNTRSIERKTPNFHAFINSSYSAWLSKFFH